MHETFDATPSRVYILSKFIHDHIKAKQAKVSANGKHYILSVGDISAALNSFIDPSNHVLSNPHPESLFKKKNNGFS